RLGEMGQRAAPAIPSLIEILGDGRTAYITIAKTKQVAYVGKTATRALVEIGSPAVGPLCEALKDKSKEVRSAAAIALGDIGDARAAEPLAALLADEHPPRKHAMDALAKLGKGATGALLTALKDWKRRDYAGIVMAKIKDPAAVEPLLQALTDNDAQARRAGAVGLGATGDRRAVAPLAKLLEDADPHVRADAADALRRFQDVPLEVWERALRDDNPQVRMFAIIGLRKAKGPRAVEMIIGALKDKAGKVRNRAVLVLRDRSAVPALVEVLGNDENRAVRNNAAMALGAIGDRRAVEPLCKTLLNDKDGGVRRGAAYALARLADPRAVEPLVTALRDKAVPVRVRAAMALGKIQDKRAVDSLIKALLDGSWEVRMCAAEALGSVGSARAVEPLVGLVKREVDNPEPNRLQ
ncbi:MAG: HEAT repeat domain-containing protein, partial [Planctomycetia bacterium]|nr:HEAT repeat domain-containing protein [Planctomycetia bacterium]